MAMEAHKFIRVRFCLILSMILTHLGEIFANLARPPHFAKSRIHRHDTAKGASAFVSTNFVAWSL